MSTVKMLSKQRALVLFSGGQDSTTSLVYALDNFDQVETVGFDYGQRNQVELICRQMVREQICSKFESWNEKLGTDYLIKLESLNKIARSALTDDNSPIETGEHGLPTTFVPGRNLFFFTYAAVIGYQNDFGTLVGGMCQTDYSGYPDCREETLKQLQQTLSLGMDTNFELVTPLMWKTKAESWALADKLGGDEMIEIIKENTHTCYNGVRDRRHVWGYGCDNCPACDLRKKGYVEWQSMIAS